jgi:SAM-dependent methyltransferase
MSTHTYTQLRRIDIDSPDRTFQHSQIIRQKPFLRQIYTDWYLTLLKCLPETLIGPVVELGSGGGFCKELIPGLITTEILPVAGVDILLDGQQLPFKERCLKGIVMVDVFHHLPKIDHFLIEAARCVKPGGVIVMVEPWNTIWSRLIYRFLHHEPFDPNAIKWEISSGGPLSCANSAMPWIVFERDRRRFVKNYPQWSIQHVKLHTPFRYLLSGGFSMPGLVPYKSHRFLHFVEDCLEPFMPYLAMFASILLVRRSS